MTDSKTIRAARLHDAHDLRIENISIPELRSGYVAIRPKFCGICGSDLHCYFSSELTEKLKRSHPLTGASLPVVFGHEWSGVVEEVAPDTPGDLKPGDKVAVFPTVSDGTCRSCTEGFTNACPIVSFMGVNGPGGGMAEKTVVPSEYVFKLPDGMDCDIGALVEPLAVAWHGISLVDGLSGATNAAVIGAGPVGCATLLGLKAQGVRNIIMAEPTSERRKFALELGASAVYDPREVDFAAQCKSVSGGEGVDVIFDCAGVGNTLQSAAACLRPRGTMVNLAVQTTPPKVDLWSMLMKEITLKCSIAYTKADFQHVIDAIANGSMAPKTMITKRIKLDDVVKEGLETLHSKENTHCKILVDISA